MHASFFPIAIAALAASAAAVPLDTRAYATWSATDVQTQVAHITIGVHFRITAPAGYIAGAPAFDVNCTPSYIAQFGSKTCTFNGPQAAGSKVEATFDYTAGVTVFHTFDSTVASGNQPDLPYNQNFNIDVTNVASA
ncbi:hypothetical protein HD806DRAFT_68631 [Xylariaceae sp. AK1471]|nr:hypothetical protein HD806DRAFT_68631 [Xylariaceae sp. AK1471]